MGVQRLNEFELQIASPTWKEAQMDSDDVLLIKEKRKFGTARRSMATNTPQVPALVVRVPAKAFDESKSVGVRAQLWDYGPASRFGAQTQGQEGSLFNKLRNGSMIECHDNVGVFGAEEKDGFRYATLRCSITRAARIPCKRHHIALRLDTVYIENTEDGGIRVLGVAEKCVPTRTRRISISEKAMCPRACDMEKKRKIRDTQSDQGIKMQLKRRCTSSASLDSDCTTAVGPISNIKTEVGNANIFQTNLSTLLASFPGNSLQTSSGMTMGLGLCSNSIPPSSMLPLLSGVQSPLAPTLASNQFLNSGTLSPTALSFLLNLNSSPVGLGSPLSQFL
mmetsp:Transcript_14790/g.24061  ORF Transcript_14790/g.24061 Transcript_14790/m.24061 type:complete len:336 (+) Transcript_14790:361-1368(+)|eukprot:CAMPEP_0203759550 /NCGR_PEP_ID=MMETSP0098-20131031/12585_1 /ASSEMBLY_ACC=CAM_ASM_000208 /TAXON_ID=96639 /ORGANISM=" , Strain NY0313808BC1" /LENGTH=335 /DNA_ID=CAMNT_0050652567 /DNA_START=334 /DNA_END=1341 /DNA_ORIENTATION=-